MSAPDGRHFAAALEPEILDGLAADDPRAVHSRRDLVHINALMFQAPIMAGLLRKHVRAKRRRILEIGAGDGTFMLAVARRLARHWPAVELTLLDRIDLVSPERRDAFAKLGWRVETVTADIFEWLGRVDTAVRRCRREPLPAPFRQCRSPPLFSGLQRLAPVLLATEPRRGSFPLAASACCGRSAPTT